MAQTEKEKQLYDYAYGTALDAALNTPKPEYAGTYENQLNDLYDRIVNREKFSYDVNADPLYQSYKDQYIQQGKLAMKDTMGQAAALTGGYGNTYGQQVGQQAYDAYLQNLSAAIPQLYGMAYDKYKDEGDQLKDLYGMAGQMRDTEYGTYRDALGDWERGQDLVRQAEQQEYNRRMDDEAIARQLEQQQYERQQYAEQIQRQLEEQAYNRRMQEEAIQRQLEQQQYQRQQDARANLLAMIKATGFYPTDAQLQAAGMTREEADALAAEFAYQRAQEELANDLAMDRATYGGSSGGGGGRSYSGGGSGYGGYDYDYDYAPASSAGRFTVDKNGDVIYTGTQEEYNNLSAATKAAAQATVAAQERGKAKTEYYAKQQTATKNAAANAVAAAQEKGKSMTEYYKKLYGL